MTGETAPGPSAFLPPGVARAGEGVRGARLRGIVTMPRARLKIRVIPRAARDELGGRRGEAFVVRLQAPPVEGAANRALVRFLARVLGVRAGDITVVAGHKSRDKTVEVEGISPGEAKKALEADG